MFMSLGVQPVGGCPISKAIGHWVAAPALPLSTFDLGARGEPNLGRWSGALRPDLIAGAYGYGIDETLFARFAPVFSVPFYDGREHAACSAAQADVRNRRSSATAAGSAGACQPSHAHDQ